MKKIRKIFIILLDFDLKSGFSHDIKEYLLLENNWSLLLRKKNTFGFKSDLKAKKCNFLY
jgi:hypothetical protein